MDEPSMSMVAVAIAAVLMFTPSAHALYFDVPPEHPYADAIEYLTRKGILKGYENRSFQPERGVARAELVKMVISMMLPEDAIDTCLTKTTATLELPSLSFLDVPKESWFAPYLCSAWVNGIVSGYPDGTFRPGDGVNLAEAAKIIALAFGFTGIELPDLGQPGNTIWYLPYVELLADRGTLPLSVREVSQKLSRAEVAEILYRLRDALSPLPPIPDLDTSRTYEEVESPLHWASYESEKHSFRIEYPDVWPAPHELFRGAYDPVPPSVHSEWRVYMGPETTRCYGRPTCVDRDITVDGYDMRYLEAALDQLETDSSVTVISETETDAMYKIVYEDDDGECRSKAAILLRPLSKTRHTDAEFYRVRFWCSAESEERAQSFRRILQSFEMLPLR